MSHLSALCDYQVTSSVVKASMNGFYPYDVRDLMIPHETIRSLIVKARTALKAFDVLEHPWKADLFATWFRYILAPIVQIHQHFEDDVAFPFYKSLGAELPVTTSTHASLKSSLDLMARRVEAVASKVKSSPGSNESVSYASQLVVDFEAWATQLEGHFAEEETVWPAVYKSFGSDKADQCSKLIINNGLSTGGKAYQMYLSAVLLGMGYTISGLPSKQKHWAGQLMRDPVLNALPTVTMTLFLPAWVKKFQELDDLIVAAAADEPTSAQDESPYYNSGDCVIM